MAKILCFTLSGDKDKNKYWNKSHQFGGNTLEIAFDISISESKNIHSKVKHIQRLFANVIHIWGNSLLRCPTLTIFSIF